MNKAKKLSVKFTPLGVRPVLKTVVKVPNDKLEKPYIVDFCEEMNPVTKAYYGSEK